MVEEQKSRETMTGAGLHGSEPAPAGATWPQGALHSRISQGEGEKDGGSH